MSETLRERVVLLDLLRGALVLVMVLYHLVYDLELFGALPVGTIDSLPFPVILWLGGLCFVGLAGYCCRFSESNLRRGLLTLACGVLVMLVTTLAGYPSSFGVLVLLGLCMLLYGLVGECFARLPRLPRLFGCALLFLFTLFLTKHVTVQARWLFPLGFIAEDFYSSDYYPLFPWAFAFFFGASLGELPEGAKHFGQGLPGALSWPGRHSLLIYLLHQPVLFGLLRLYQLTK